MNTNVTRVPGPTRVIEDETDYLKRFASPYYPRVSSTFGLVRTPIFPTDHGFLPQSSPAPGSSTGPVES